MLSAMRIDLTGRIFGKLRVESEGESLSRSNGKRRRRWMCSCECGEMALVIQESLLRGATVSCGCYRKAFQSAGGSRLRHGFARKSKQSRTHGNWVAMRQRCENPTNAVFPRYGGRGIKVCARWQVFENFLADMGEKPKGKTIDRFPNNDGDYEPGNCRWATPGEQARNTRRNHPLTAFGETLLLVEWAEKVGVPGPVLLKRLNRGWSPEKTVSTPLVHPGDRRSHVAV